MTFINSIEAPFQFFSDSAGRPLEGGHVFIGQPGLEARTNPKASFFNAALTVPTGTASGAAVRTSRGLLVGPTGSPATIYVDGDYSITVLNANFVLVYSALNAASFGALAPINGLLSFSTRAEFIAAQSTALTLPDGTTQVAGGYAYIRDSASTAIPDLPGWRPARPATPYHFGAVPGAGADQTTRLQSWLDLTGWLDPGEAIWRVDGVLTLKSNTSIIGTRGKSTFYQYGPKLFQGQTDLRNFVMEDLIFDFRSQGGALDNSYSVWANLDSHEDCKFGHLTWVRYDNLTILERHPTNAATVNTIKNHYGPWDISACAHITQSIGHEGTFVFRFQGNGSTTVINTGLAWPETFNSSVVVLRESSNRIFSELVRGTDYTVAYPSGICTVTMTTAPGTSERIHIYPSTPIPSGGGNRRPISNNTWSVFCRYVFIRGFQDVRWVDAERYSDSNLSLAGNFARAFVHNPYELRTGQGGDYSLYDNVIVTYQEGASFVTDPNTVRAFEFGPGSFGMRGLACIFDFEWIAADGSNHAITSRDREAVTISGLTVNTNNTNTITAATGSFTDHFSALGGAARDRIRIGGVEYTIATISASSMTLGATVPGTATGLACERISITSKVEYNLDNSALGYPFATGKGNMGTFQTATATSAFGTATINSGASSVVVTHNLNRTPRTEEITITPAGAAAASWWISNRTATTFQVNIPSAAGVGTGIGWRVDLKLPN